MPCRHFAFILNWMMALQKVAPVTCVLVPRLFRNESCEGDAGDELLHEIVCRADDTLPVLGQSWLFTAEPLIGVSVVFAMHGYEQIEIVNEHLCFFVISNFTAICSQHHCGSSASSHSVHHFCASAFSHLVH